MPNSSPIFFNGKQAAMFTVLYGTMYSKWNQAKLHGNRQHIYIFLFIAIQLVSLLFKAKAKRIRWIGHPIWKTS